MYLVQILLPLYDNRGEPFAKADFDGIRRTLTETFGGVTAYSRAPAEGDWKESNDSTAHDDIVVYEVMAGALDRDWWAKQREEWRVRFRQDELIVRAMACELL